MKDTNTPLRAYPPPVADIHELSYQTGIAESTIRLYVSNGWLPGPHPVGNKKLWIMADVIAHIARCGGIGDDGPNTDPEIDEYDAAWDDDAAA